MQTACDHYEKQTGCEFYGLAANHYSVPDWTVKYHPGGKQIEYCVTILPSRCIFTVLFGSFVVLVAMCYRRNLRGALLTFYYHLLWATVFALLAGWYQINITGVFV